MFQNFSQNYSASMNENNDCNDQTVPDFEHVGPFMLPLLVQDNLVEDDSDEYAFVSYEKNSITNATKEVLNQIGKYPSSISLTSKKRVTVIMEFMAVALSVYVEEYNYMTIARNFYREWLENSDIFGSMERQNKYLRRIIKQLSMPFKMEEKGQGSKFPAPYVDLLKEIINDYAFLHTKRGTDMDEKTWKTLLFVLIGICDMLLINDLKPKMNEEDLSKLKRKTITCCFSVINGSGIKDKDIWGIFLRYTYKWSSDHDFVLCWNTLVNAFFKKLINIYYGLNEDGSDVEKKQTTSFLFHQTLISLDVSKAHDNPILINEIYDAIYNITDTAIDLANNKSNFFMYKFPGFSFLKLFGKFISFAKASECDEGFSKNISTIIKIISFFEFKGVNSEIEKYIGSFKTIDYKQVKTVSSFIKNANTLFQSQSRTLPFISSVSLDFINNYNFENNLTEEELELILSLYLSSSAVLSNNLEFDDVIISLFNKLWDKSGRFLNIKFKLLSHPVSYKYAIEVNILKKILTVLQNNSNFQSFIIKNTEFAIGCIQYLGIIVLFKPDICNEIINTKMIVHILNLITYSDISAIPKKDKIVCSYIQMLISFIENAPTLFKVDENVDALFEFLVYLQNLNIRSDNKHKAKRRSDVNLNTAPPKRSKSMIQSEKTISTKSGQGKIKNISALLEILKSRLVLHLPLKDIYTRRVDSGNEINEEAVIKEFKLNNIRTNYYTVGQSLLVSFTESKDQKAPFIIFARGPFGKSIWTAYDKYKLDDRTPELSNDIKKEGLPEPVEINNIGIDFRSEKFNFINPLKEKELKSIDKIYFDKYEKIFSSYIDWDIYGEYYALNYEAPYQRPKIVDFLGSMGLFENNNKLDIHEQSDPELIKKAIKDFDSCEFINLTPIKVIHILPCDKEVKYIEDHIKRMTPIMLNFLQKIGEPLDVPRKSSEKRGLPIFKSTVPAIPALLGYGIIVLPALSGDSESIKQIEELDSPIKIIFNETNFDLNYKCSLSEKSVVLVIKPNNLDLYNVKLIQGVTDGVTPFTCEQTLSISELSFYLSFCLQLTNSSYKIKNIVRERRNAFIDLTKSKTLMQLGPLSSGVFNFN